MAPPRHPVGPSRNIRIYNNTAICLEQPDCVFAGWDKDCTNIVLKNNLMLSQSDSRNGNIFGKAEAGKSELDRNIFFSRGSATDPKIANVKLPECANVGVRGVGLDEADFAALFKDFAAPSAGSPVINAGTGDMGRSLDFHGNLRDDKPDIGAIEYLADKKLGDKPVVIEVRPTPKPLSQPANPDQPKPVQNGPAANGNGSAGGVIQTTAPPADSDDPESQAKRRLSAAKIYVATDPARAKDLLRKVITDFPGTEASKEARKELGKLN
ncbi:MAG: hypothetical protein HZA50_13060 [Planctomycetes bacterium]|nr:hypothetical protein [Planctomycetota bacterium]